MSLAVELAPRAPMKNEKISETRSPDETEVTYERRCVCGKPVREPNPGRGPWATCGGPGCADAHLRKLYEDGIRRHVDQEPMLRYFEYDHLPEHLRNVSQPLFVLAHSMVEALPPGPERTAGLRKLLEAKDCFVRAKL